MSAVARADRAADPGHDLRVLREPDRAQAEQARRRQRDRQLRDREGDASSSTPAAVAPEQLVAAVEAAGYAATLPRRRRRRAEADGRRDAAAAAAPARLRGLLSLPLLLISMIPALQFDNWQWLALQLATPVVVWGAWPFHRAAWANLQARRPRRWTRSSPRRARRLALVALRALPRRRRRGRHADDLRPGPAGWQRRERDLPRDRRGRDDLHPRRPLLRGAREAPRRRRAAARCSSSARRTSRSSGPTAASDASPIEQLAGRRPLRRPPGREGRDRRRRRGGPLGGRHEHADRRVRPGRGRAPAPRSPGATVNAGGRLVVRATTVGADTALAQIARLVERRPDGQGAGAAARRPHRGRLRAGRDRPRGRDARLLARERRRRDLRLHRRGRGADHRLPLRARPRDADGAARRHRPRRPARPADQGPRGARVDPPRRHDRARQDRHRHDGHDGARRRRRRRGVERDEALRLVGALEDASEHPIARAIARRRGRASAAAARGRGIPQPRGPRRRGHRRRARASSPAGRRCSPEWGARAVPPELDALERAQRRAGRRRSPSPGTARRARRVRRRRHGQADERGGDRARCGRSGCGRCCSPATTRDRRAPSPRRSASTRSIAEVLPADKADVVRRLQAKAVSSRWSATASTTPPRSPRPTSGSRSAPAPTWRSRRATSRSSAAT